MLNYWTTTRVHLDYQASTGNVGIIITTSSERGKNCIRFVVAARVDLIVPELHVHGGWCLERAWLEDGS